jgi:Holliday junction resolvasome RuvABC endonuclease subunit
MPIKKLTKKKPKTILGLDSSTNSCAFCLFGKNGPIKWGEIEFAGDNVFERLSDGQRKVGASLKHLNPDMIVFESAIFVQNKKTVVLLAYAFGAIVASLMKKGTQVEEIPPITWQNAIGNKALTKDEKLKIQKEYPDKKTTWYQAKYREVRKQKTINWVKKNYGIDVPNDNVSDAIAIAAVGYEKFAS